ncbi:hypothetical protein HKX48_006420 [Thoreauomyces humboldtii]|nr:hypothetical protein HKX48_006420 [Thoreauomyces humboldtii]
MASKGLAALNTNTASGRTSPGSPSGTNRRLRELLPRLRAKGSDSPEQMLSDVLDQLSPLPTPSTPTTPGSTSGLDGYRLIRTIGEGAFGKVKLATHIATGESVAIKMLKIPQRVGESEATGEDPAAGATTRTERVLREILVHAQLAHPNITRLLQVIYKAPETVFLVLEYEPGGDLFDFVAKYPAPRLPEDVARPLFLDLLAAVQYCHTCGVVHRDLKPENLLLSPSKRLKLIDYGFTNILREDGKELSTFCGSASYAAPEMIARKDYTGPEVDLWSVGVILYVMVCGAMPFDEGHPGRMYAAIMGAKYTLPDTLSDDCRDLITRILQKLPSDRLTLEQIRDHPWTMARGTIPAVRFYVPAEGCEGRPAPSSRDPIDSAVVRELVALGYDGGAVTEAVETGEPGPLTAAYWLVVERLKRNAMDVDVAPTDRSGRKLSKLSSGGDGNEEKEVDSSRQQQHQQRVAAPGRQPLRVIVGGGDSASRGGSPAAATSSDQKTSSGSAMVDSAIDPYTPRSAPSMLLPEVLMSPGGTSASRLVDGTKYTYVAHPTTLQPSSNSSLLNRIRHPTVQSHTTRKSVVLPLRSTLETLTRNPDVTLEPISDVSYGCTVSPSPTFLGSPLEAQSPEMAMQMILGDLVGSWKFKIEVVGTDQARCEEDEGFEGDFEPALRSLLLLA